MKPWWVLASAMVFGMALAGAGATRADDGLGTLMGTLGRRLAESGRGEVPFERIAPSPFGGEPSRISGRLALEPPHLAELRFPSTGERLTLRGDGGEWLQPEMQQLIRFEQRHASSALRWWQAVLGAGANDLVRRPAGDREWILVAPAARGVPADSVRVRLTPQGLPERLEVHEGSDTPSVYSFGAWKFSRARGARAFAIEAPKGYAVVPAP